jgi:phenylalanyl-tRNA synthetase beta chain
MNISYNWLKDLLDIGLSPDHLAQELTRVGLAVEGIHPHGDDHVFDIDLTSNRPDCLSHLGVAREIGVITNTAMRALQPAASGQLTDPVENTGLVTIEDSQLCHRFTARIIRNVKIGPSPAWLVERLEAIGERAINNVADITNYVMHELGQPMHAFDLDKLAENRIVVRRARPGDAIKTLDGLDRELDSSILAICDAGKPVAVAGIMGGFDSAISDQTTNVLIEVAYFQRDSIRRSSRKLNLATEASYRFERGVDIQNLKRASDRAAELICDLAGGNAEEFVDVYPTPFGPNRIKSNDISAAVKRLTGLDVAEPECARILSALGISAEADSQIFLSPSWRHDIAIEEDLVEEIARHAGYENIADELPPALGAGEYQPGERRKARLRGTLVTLGFDEAVSYSFIDTSTDGTFDLVPGIVDGQPEEDFVTLRDAVIEGAVRMRPTLLPGLLDAVRTNFNHRRRDISLFEIGKVFAARIGEDSLPYERELLAIVMTGGEMLDGRAVPSRPLDFFDAKGALESALDAADVSGIEFTARDVRHLRRGQSAAVLLNGKSVGFIGRLSDEINAAYKFRQPVYVAEVDLQTLLAANRSPAEYRPLPKYPSVVRDVTLLARRDVTLAALQDAILDQNAELCSRVEFVDVYQGKELGDDLSSVTIRLEYRNDERTLTEEEVDEVHNAIVARLAAETGAKQRT